jgi:hypothetical protein
VVEDIVNLDVSPGFDVKAECTTLVGLAMYADLTVLEVRELLRDVETQATA